MNEQITTFREILRNVDRLSTRCWIYMPEAEPWSLNSKAAVLESEEVPPNQEDDPDAGIPNFAKENDLMQALPVADLQDIVRNAKEQDPSISEETLFKAFLYYYDHDAYIVF